MDETAKELLLIGLNAWISSQQTTSESLQIVGEKVASGEEVDYEDLGFSDRRDEGLAEAFALNPDIDSE